MQQELLAHDDIYDAVKATAHSYGGVKKLAPEIWPDLPQTQAVTKFHDCCNRDRPQKFSPEELKLIMTKGRSVGVDAIMEHLCADVGYEPPRPYTPEDQKAALQREYIEAVNRLDRISARIKGAA